MGHDVCYQGFLRITPATVDAATLKELKNHKFINANGYELMAFEAATVRYRGHKKNKMGEVRGGYYLEIDTNNTCRFYEKYAQMEINEARGILEKNGYSLTGFVISSDGMAIQADGQMEDTVKTLNRLASFQGAAMQVIKTIPTTTKKRDAALLTELAEKCTAHAATMNAPPTSTAGSESSSSSSSLSSSSSSSSSSSGSSQVYKRARSSPDVIVIEE